MKRASKAFGEQAILAALSRVLITVVWLVCTAPVWFPLLMLTAMVLWGPQQ